MNKIFSFIISFFIGMMLCLPFFSYTKMEAERYSYAPTTMLYPKHPIVECIRSPRCSKLSEVGYFEARGESDLGVIAVFSVVLNRKNNPRWEDTIIDVVNSPHQFSYLTDGSLEKAPYNVGQWARMYWLAYNFLHSPENLHLTIPPHFSTLTHYHSTRVHPRWAKHYKYVATIGSHKFYECKRRC